MTRESAVEAQRRLVLASGSPRRRDMLAALGASFEVRSVDIDESVEEGESAAAYVLRLAEAKARRAALEGVTGELVLAADTIVVLGGDILGKPADSREAADMLRRLSGRWHEVLTGVALHEAARTLCLVHVERTRVRFSTMSEEEIARYVATGEPLDKAGAYGIQGHGGLFVEGIEGSYSNVVGLPLQLLYQLLCRLGRERLIFPG